MRYLALDIGKRRTGVAFYDEATGIPLPLDTLRHTSVKELLAQVHALVDVRKIDRLICGLPLLPSGQDGEQSQYVRDIAEQLTEHGIVTEFQDERYTTPRKLKSAKNAEGYGGSGDGDAAAACEILRSHIRI